MSKVSILENAYQVTQGYCLIRAIDRTHLQIGVFDINKQLLGSEVISGRIENQRFCRNQAMAFIQKFNMEFEVVTESYTFHVQSLNLPAVIFNVSSKSGRGAEVVSSFGRSIASIPINDIKKLKTHVSNIYSSNIDLLKK